MVGFAMAHLSGTDRSQMLLLPEAVDTNLVKVGLYAASKSARAFM